MCYYIFLTEGDSLIHISYAVVILISTAFCSLFALHYYNEIELMREQKHINDKSTLRLVRAISTLAEDIHIATYPGECDLLTKEIIGEECDLGNYMEWAGPTLDQEIKILLTQLSND